MSLPGRRGNPELSLATDPRTHRGLLKGLEAHGMQHNTFLTANIAPEAPLAEIVAFARESEKALESMIDAIDFTVAHPWSRRAITKTGHFVAGVDDNHIQLTIYRPADQAPDELLPAVVYFHGGGMVMLSTQSPLHTTYVEAIAQMGIIAILVDFRNVLGSSSSSSSSTTTTTTTTLHPFPAGLNDCVSAAKWVHAQKQDLRIQKIILHGDSGGGNLALATALKLNASEDTQSTVDGVFALDPYISGAYDRLPSSPHHLPSLAECDGYDVSCSSCALYARLYDQQGLHRHDKFAWPLHATEAELRGLPPHVITVAELDPLRDEGREYCMRLVRAGVRAVGRVRVGMTHSGELLLRKWVPDEFGEGLAALGGFVGRV